MGSGGAPLIHSTFLGLRWCGSDTSVLILIGQTGGPDAFLKTVPEGSQSAGLKIDFSG